MRIDAQLPTNLWPEVVKAAGYISNRTPTRKISWKTPFEAVRGQPPRLSHMHIYGCKAYALKQTKERPKKAKLDPRAHIGYLVGYDSTNIFRIWVPSLSKVIRCRDVQFDDNSGYDPHDIDAVYISESRRIIESVDILSPSMLPELEEEEEVYDSTTVIPPSEIAPDSTTIVPFEPLPLSTHLPTPRPTPSASSPTSASTDGDTPTPGAPGNSAPRGNEISGQLNIANIITTQRNRMPSRRAAHATALQDLSNLSGYMNAFATALQVPVFQKMHQKDLPPEPKSWKDMLRHRFSEQFQVAATQEFRKLQQKETFEYVDITDQQETLLPLLWVFKYKFDSDGYLTKFKARLCARGDLQPTMQDTYAATLAAQTFRAMMAIIAAFDLEMRQYDAINAFVNAKLPMPKIMECPEGFKQNGKALCVQRALYGLREAPLLWYREFTENLEELGLYPVPGVNCLYTNDWLTIIFYVDDIIAIYSSRHTSKMDHFEAQLLQKYEIRALGETNHFLGVRILRDRPNRKLWLSQDSYIENFGHKFNVTVAKTPKTPLPSTTLQLYSGQATPQQTYGYQQRIGSLNFPGIITRPDIARACSKLSEYLQNPGPEHIAAAEHLSQYLVATKNLAIEYSGSINDHKVFLIWSDAAFADDKITRFSSCGFCLQLFGGIIHYKATKQRTVTTSSTEAELLALSNTAKEYMWWIRLFKAINFDLHEEQPTIYCDNQQTIRLLNMEAPRLVTKLKHVDIHQCWLRQEVQKGNIQTEWIPTADMVADGFTKELPAQKHANFVKQLNLVDISHLLSQK
jgi:reverse transcriptase-like protein